MKPDLHSFSPWILPRLSAAIPHAVRPAAAKGSQIAGDLAIALLELGLATQADLDISADESILARRVMTRWWSQLTEGMPLFDWELSIRSGKNVGEYGDTGSYFCVAPIEETLPYFHIGSAISQLEAECPGLGQTTMAVLEDALRYLPYNLAPASVLGLAQWFYWQGEFDEVKYAELEVDQGYHDEQTVDDFLANNEVFKRADFFRNIPEWLPFPKRVCSRKRAIRDATSPLARNVINACDAISAYGNRPEFIKHASRDAFGTDVGVDLVAATFVLAWDGNDCTGRVIDDAFNMFIQGEYVEMITVSHIEVSTPSIQKRLRAMEEGLGLARLVADLVLLIGERQE